MLNDVALTNYRSFESYELTGLSRVNLLVGENNCGKTSILEAVHILASRGHPGAFKQLADQRGEDGSHYRRDGIHPRVLMSFSHFFRGHDFGPGARFSIASGNGEEVEATVAEFGDSGVRRFPAESGDDKAMALHIKVAGAGRVIVLPASDDGLVEANPRWVRRAGFDARPSTAVGLVTAASLDVKTMRRMWDEAVEDGRELDVIEAMKVVEHDLESVFFLSSDSKRGDIVLGFGVGTPRIPIGSHGDGTRRLLAMALSLPRRATGVSLIDEIDTGLHWTVLEDMWRFVVESAVRTDIQVFATTHSQDCLRALASLVDSRPDLAQEISVQKIERALPHAVGFDGAAVKRAIDHNIELR